MLLIPWLLLLPGHQQPWYWICSLNASLTYILRKHLTICATSVLRNDRKYKCNVAISKRNSAWAAVEGIIIQVTQVEMELTHWHPVMQYCVVEHGQHWLRVMAWCLDGTKSFKWNEPLLAFISALMWHLSDGISTVSVQDIHPRKVFENLQPHNHMWWVNLRVHKGPQSSLVASNFSWSLAYEAQR